MLNKSDALAQPPAPCDTCKMKSQCKEFHLACSQFDKYCQLLPWREETRLPTKEIYRRVFAWKPTQDDGGQA